MTRIDLSALRSERLHVEQEGPAEGVPVVLMHGLFGNLKNLSRVARQLRETRPVVAVDLRNHGASPHTPIMDYPHMAADVLAVMDRLGVDTVDLVGHSMGGKVAMTFAGALPDRVRHLVVIDIAPVRYPDRFTAMIHALRSAPRDAALERRDIDAALKDAIPDGALRAFLLQNLTRTERGWRWRCDLGAIESGLPALMDMPELPSARVTGQATLIAGGPGALVPDERHRDLFRQRFPGAAVQTMPEVGHWPHVEDPVGFMAHLRVALGELSNPVE